MIDRRAILTTGLAAGAAAIAGVSIMGSSLGAGSAATGARRMLLVVLRGAADGLSIAAPLGDPAFNAARGAWAEGYAAAPKLDGTFRLHPALKNFAKFYGEGDALVGHALATSYRERSHFDAQNILETGGVKAYERTDGFLNRFIGLVGPAELPSLALSPAVPLAFRGPNAVKTYAPSKLPEADDLLTQRLPMLYESDGQLAKTWQAAAEVKAAAGGEGSAGTTASLGAVAAKLMTGAQPADLVMIDLPGWDTHSGQIRQLGLRLEGLDALLGAFREGIGAGWKDTMVAVVTEFGRTVAINGSAGTDHGTAGAALLLGGTVKGGRVVTDWPGLSTGQLYEGRDLRPTRSLESFLAGAMAGHFGIDPGRTFATLFPGRSDKPLEGLIG